MKQIIALVGMCGSGKSSAAQVLQELQLKGVYFGQLTLDYLKEKKRPTNLQEEKWAREKIRQEHGMAAFAKLALPRIKTLLEDNDLIYIDGLYSLEEYEFLKANLTSKIVLLEIYLDKLTRHQRLGKRKERSLTLKECEERDLNEIKNLNKAGPIALSDYKIQNNLGIKELSKSLNHFLSNLKN